MLVGKALCTEPSRILNCRTVCNMQQDYNLDSRKLTSSPIPSVLILNAFPDWLKPTASKLTTIVNRIYVSRCMRHLKPMFTQRIADAEALERNPNSKSPLPNDLIAWAINDALDRGEGLESLLIGRLFMVNFAAVETSTATITNTLYDLFTMAPEEKFAEGVQEEAVSVLKNVGDHAKKEDVLKLVRTNSTIRETLRQRTIFVALKRQVTTPDGVTMDDGLQYICRRAPDSPYPQLVSTTLMTSGPMRQDTTLFAIVRSRKRPPRTGKQIHPPRPIRWRQRATTTCPLALEGIRPPSGSFAADEMKLIIGHIFQRYELKYVDPKRVGQSPIANLNADILIRRRPEMLPTKGM